MRQEYLYVGAWLAVLPALERVRCTVGRLPSHPPRTEGHSYMFIIYGSTMLRRCVVVALERYDVI
jgi:hypothetical protein